MDKLNFYTVDLRYVDFLKNVEQEKRGFSRVPNLDYGTQQKPDNFLIKAANGQVVSSLRFNYMFPVPDRLISVRIIEDEPDRAYRALLSQELRYCIKNQEIIRHLAERTYKRVLLAKNPGLVVNSCDFRLLEQAYCSYF